MSVESADVTPSRVGPRAGIRRNTLINLVGSSLPIVVSLATVPLYLDVLGLGPYGILIIVWALLGYFGAFDFGLGAAVAHRIAQLPRSRSAERSTVVSTALVLGVVVGLVGGVVLYGIGRIVVDITPMDETVRAQTLRALPLLALAIPIANAFWLLIGAFEGLERFVTANALIVTSVVSGQLVPLGIAFATDGDLTWVIAAIVAVSALNCALASVVCTRAVPLGTGRIFDGVMARSLARFGGWIMTTALIQAFFVTADKLVIGAMIGPRAVAQYGIPSNLVNRLVILPASLRRTLFPRLSRLDQADARSVQDASLLPLAAIMVPITVIGIFAIEPFLSLWVGESVARVSGPVGQILLLGFWLNTIAVIPFTYLQARRRPDLPAKFNLLEVPLYLALLWTGLEVMGIEGAAWAWTARTLVDAALLFGATRISARTCCALCVAAAPVVLAYILVASNDHGHGYTIAEAAVVLLSLAGALVYLRRPQRRGTNASPSSAS